MRIAIIDVETGGLDEKVHGLTQVASIIGSLTDNFGKVEFNIEDTFHALVKPIPGYEYGQEALDYQGITLETLSCYGGNITAILYQLAAFIIPVTSIAKGRVWAHEDTFDFKFMRQATLFDLEYGNNDPRVREWMGIKDPRSLFCRSNWQCSKRLSRLCISLGIVNSTSDSLLEMCNNLQIQDPVHPNKPLYDCHKTGLLIAELLTRLGIGSSSYFLNR